MAVGERGKGQEKEAIMTDGIERGRAPMRERESKNGGGCRERGRERRRWDREMESATREDEEGGSSGPREGEEGGSDDGYFCGG